MDPIDLTAVPASTATGDGAPVDGRAAEREKVKQLAQQFESMLITNMLHEMRKTLLTSDDEEKQGLGADVMTDTIDSQLGDALAKAGGVGLQSVLLRAFDRPGQLTGVSRTETEPTSESHNETQVRPFSQTKQSDRAEIAIGGTVTSGFGWRTDPFSGAARFHHGVDLRAAYGSDVHAAGSGTVSFAGEQRGYGLTLVIDHGNGVQTRYAHLSGTTVRTGDAVGSGQVVARTGNSGRSTAPHLHMELLRDGHPVDPGAVIKGVGEIADSTAYRSDHEEHTR